MASDSGLVRNLCLVLARHAIDKQGLSRVGYAHYHQTKRLARHALLSVRLDFIGEHTADGRSKGVQALARAAVNGNSRHALLAELGYPAARRVFVGEVALIENDHERLLSYKLRQLGVAAAHGHTRVNYLDHRINERQTLFYLSARPGHMTRKPLDIKISVFQNSPSLGLCAPVLRAPYIN